MADWDKAAAKLEYITTGTSYRKLAQKYGVSYVQIGNVGREEKWVELRKQHLNNTLTKTVAAVEDAKAERAKKVQDVADKLLHKIEAMVDRPGMMPKDIRSLVAAVKDLKEIQGVKSELDEKEQKARIANLEKQANKDDSGAGGPTLVVEGLPEEFKV